MRQKQKEGKKMKQSQNQHNNNFQSKKQKKMKKKQEFLKAKHTHGNKGRVNQTGPKEGNDQENEPAASIVNLCSV